MVQFTTTIKKFRQNGEKTGWTYIEIPQSIANKIKPGTKTAYRVKGRLDDYEFSGLSLVPMGGGDFILPLNATLRKAIGKGQGARLKVIMDYDEKGYVILAELLECLKDEPAAFEFFNSLPKGHQNYFSKWVEAAKTDATRAKRIAMTVSATAKNWGYPEMIRTAKKQKDELE